MSTASRAFLLFTLVAAATALGGGAGAALRPDAQPGADPAREAQPRMTIAAEMRRAAVADPNLDGEVSPVEATRYFETRFRLLDADRDGWVDRAEFLRSVVVRSVVAADSFAPPRTREFESIDLDGDGSLTPEEFLRAALLGRTAADAGEDGSSPRQAMFDLVDGDGDGALSRQEFIAAGSRDYERSDADGDGRVTIWEFYGSTRM